MASANERQVGGAHYRAGFQHWDLMIFNRVPYLEAQITRYVSRWQKKNGVQDVEKAFHYLEKLEESLNSGLLTYPTQRFPNQLDQFVRNNGLCGLEQQILQYALTYTTPGELLAMRCLMENLLDNAKRDAKRNPTPVV